MGLVCEPFTYGATNLVRSYIKSRQIGRVYVD